MFLSQTPPTGLSDVIALPLICFALGIGIWYVGLHFESRTEKVWLKWLALVPLTIGLLIGIQATVQTLDYAYKQSLPNQRTLYGHYLALLLPASAIIAVVAWHFYLKKSGGYHSQKL